MISSMNTFKWKLSSKLQCHDLLNFLNVSSELTLIFSPADKNSDDVKGCWTIFILVGWRKVSKHQKMGHIHFLINLLMWIIFFPHMKIIKSKYWSTPTDGQLETSLRIVISAATVESAQTWLTLCSANNQENVSVIFQSFFFLMLIITIKAMERHLKISLKL